MIYYELIVGRQSDYIDGRTGELKIAKVERRKVLIEVDIRSGRNPFEYLFDTAKKIMREDEYLISLKEADITIVISEDRH